MKQLPSRPNLQHLREQAKDLFSSFRAGDPSALQRLKDSLPSAKDTHKVVLTDCQFALAREHGFASWDKMRRHLEEIKSLEGTWQFRSLEVNGSGMPGYTFADSRLTINGTQFHLGASEGSYAGDFTVDLDKRPKLIDMHFTEGPEAGNSSYGIYALTGDEWTICLGLTGSPRPTEFKTKPGSNHALEVLTKESSTHVRPATPQPVSLPADASPLTAEELRLQGEWRSITVVRDGDPLPKSWIESGRRVVEGRRLVVSFGGSPFMQADVSLNSDASPCEIDYHLCTGPGGVQLGIYRWEVERLTTCFGAPGAPRPTEFASAVGSGCTLSSWERT